MWRGRYVVLSHRLHAPGPKPSPPVAPHRASCIPSTLGDPPSPTGTTPSASQQLGLGAGALHGAVGACRSLVLCQRNQQHKGGGLQGGGLGGTGLETPACALGPQPRALSRSPDPRVLGLMHHQREKWWKRPRTEKSHGLWRVATARGGPTVLAETWQQGQQVPDASQPVGLHQS